MLGTSLNLLSLMILTSNKIILRRYKTLIVITSILLTLSYLIRPESGKGVIVIFSLFIFLKVLMEIREKSLNLVDYFIVILTFFAVFFLNLILVQKHKNQEWILYNEWNSMRHQIQHRMPQNHLLEMRTQIEWTIPEYHLFTDLSFGDPSVFNSDWLRPAFKETEKFRGINGLFNSDAQTIILKFTKVFDFYRYIIFLNLLFLAFLVIAFRFDKMNYLILFLSVMCSLLVLFIMSVTLHAPNRVVVPLLLFPLFLCLYSLSERNTFIRNNSKRIYFYPIIIIFTVLYSGIMYFQNSKNIYEIKNAIKKNEWLIDFNKSAIFIGPVGTETYHLTSPYFKQNINDLPTIFTTGNWDTFSPNWFKRMNYLGLKSKSIYENLFDEKVFWITYPQPDSAYQVELYLKEKNYPSFTRQNIKEHDSGLTIYKFNEAN